MLLQGVHALSEVVALASALALLAAILSRRPRRAVSPKSRMLFLIAALSRCAPLVLSGAPSLDVALPAALAALSAASLVLLVVSPPPDEQPDTVFPLWPLVLGAASVGVGSVALLGLTGSLSALSVSVALWFEVCALVPQYCKIEENGHASNFIRLVMAAFGVQMLLSLAYEALEWHLMHVVARLVAIGLYVAWLFFPGFYFQKHHPLFQAGGGGGGASFDAEVIVL